MSRIGIDFISFLAMPPVESVQLAADLGCGQLSLALAPFTANPHNYPAWSLRDDAALRKATRAALDERGIVISMAEGFLLRPGADIRDGVADLDLHVELGSKRANIASIEPGLARNVDQCGAFAEMCAQRGMEMTLEFGPIFGVRDLAGALEVLRQVGNPNLRLMVDALHVFRSGTSVAELQAVAPEQIGYVQLCDAPMDFSFDQYMDEGRNNRMVPGEGEFPLQDFLAAMPRHVVVGLELPMLAKAEAGMSLRDALAPAVAATQALLARIG